MGVSVWLFKEVTRQRNEDFDSSGKRSLSEGQRDVSGRWLKKSFKAHRAIAWR